MFRQTKNSHQDITQIVKIYNDITGRNRTENLHAWEWFESPYENQSYVIVDKDDKILGHHGILTIELNYLNHLYATGKTENTIIKKGYGPLYFKNELGMHKEYIKNYDILITTAAHGVTRKIREKLGYKIFSEYVTHKQPIDINLIQNKINTSILKHILTLLSPLINLFFTQKNINTKYKEQIHTIQENDLYEIQDFYKSVKEKIGFSQMRSKSFLLYRILNNPYINFSILKIYDKDILSGYLIYYIKDDKIIIEDIMFDQEKEDTELLNRLFNYCKKGKVGNMIVFTTLVDSILDKKYKGFFRTFTPDSSLFMVKTNMLDKEKNNLEIKDFYFTKLMTEGIQ